MPVNPREIWAAMPARRWIRGIAVVLGLALVANLVFAFLTMERGAWRGLTGVSPAFLALAVGLALVPWLTNTLRLWIWARFEGARISPAEAFRIVLACDLGAAFTPTVAGTEAVALTLLMRHGVSAGRASALVMLITLQDAVFFIIFLPLSYLLASGTGGPVVQTVFARMGERALWVLGGALVLGLVATLIWKMLRGRVAESARPGVRGVLDKLGRWWREARALFVEVARRGKTLAAITLGLTTVQWICRYSVVAAVLAAFGLEVFPFTHLVLQWVVFTAGTLIPTPGGATAVETAFAVIYQPLVPAAWLGTVTAVWRFLLFYLVLILDALILSVFILRAGPSKGVSDAAPTA